MLLHASWELSEVSEKETNLGTINPLFSQGLSAIQNEASDS